ncbi:MAG: hypothetical protein GY820_38185 [Gammaproteobacteria bacterium]|nr:hypothetical protein [Gammaproteobacteria bacterium]
MEIERFILDILMLITASMGVSVAYMGLLNWKEQTKGKADHDLARRILVDLYRYRAAIHNARNPFLHSNLIPSPSKEQAKFMSKKQITFYGKSGAYQDRLSEVIEERTAIQAELIEAEAVWGPELIELFVPIKKLEDDLYVSIHYHIELINPDIAEDEKEDLRAEYPNYKDILYENINGEPDEFKKDFMDSLAKVEEYLKPKLIR